MASSSSGPAAGGLLAQASISPADGRLVFSLPAAASSSACTCALTITNTSSTTGPCLAFKVKTTKPKRYLVRPCQGVLRPGELQEVSVSVVIPPGGLGEVLRALGAEEHDKFQVLYAGIDEAAYWVVTGQGGEGSSNGQQQHHQQQQRLDRVWAKLDKRMVLERRLDVEFSRAPPQQHQQPSSSSLAPSASVSSGPMTMAEYRKRYDDLVTVTVGLTAERDSLLNALDTLKFELRRELTSQGERGQHVAAGGTVKQDQLSVHKRRRSKASSAAFMSSIPGIAAHAREPSSGLSPGPTGAGGRYHAEKRQRQQQQHHHAPEKRRFSTKAVAAAAVVAFLMARWLT